MTLAVSQQGSKQTADKNAIRPFQKVNIPEAELTELRRRINNTQWPERLTNTALSGARLYWENKFPYFSVKGVSVPVAVSAFPDELYQCPRNWAESAYPKLIHYNKLPKGGHFAA